jgi:DNA-binding NtrC family response regulator
MDTLSRLVEGAIAITSSASPTDALIALNEDHFDLVVIGLQPDHTIPVNFVARLRGLQPDLPILAVGDPVAPRYADYVRKRGVHEVVNLPKSAAEMKNLAVALARRYLLSRD